MAIQLDINPKQLTENLEVQYLPAEIESNAEANVDDYFNNYTTKNENGNLSNSLRGFPLDGIKFEVPANLKGVVFQESKRTSEECSSGRLLRVTGTFDNLTYWNYDKVPSAADGLRQGLQVLSVVDELSKPISAEDIQNEIEQKKMKTVNIKAEE